MKNIMTIVKGAAIMLGAVMILSGCAGKKSQEAKKDNKGKDMKWDLLINKSKIDGKVNIGQFTDDKKGITVGYSGEIHYTEDGGKTWPNANNQSMCRFGISMVSNMVGATCGNSGTVRISTDGGKNWTDGGKFLDRNYYISFIDEKNGWVADSSKLGATTDGGKTYNEITLPKDMKAIATICLAKTGSGYVLNTEGKLYITKDGGKTWKSKNVVLPGEKISIQTGNMQYSALTFVDDRKGIAVIINKDGKKAVYRTEDGGDIWKKEELPECEAAFGVTVSPDGKYITITGIANTVSVLKYKD